MKLKIIPFDGKNAVHTAQAANILAECFPHCYADCAEEEIAQYPSDERIAFVAVEEESGDVLGFIGGIEDYDGNVWELHPLCVAKSRQRKGIGTLLLQALEAECAARGAMTVTLGSDDEFFSTTLSGCDLYDDLWGRIAAIRNLKNHPYEFYLKNGYRITGVLPDANGCGKPDILMSKRVGSFSDRT